MSAKIDWIKTQIPLVDNFGDLNTPSLVANSTTQGTVPKPLSIADVAGSMTPADRRLLQNEGAYNSLLENYAKGQLLDVLACIQNLATTPNLSADAVTKLNAALVTAQETMLDPNWQAQIFITPAALAGFDAVTLQEWEQAIA